MNDFFQLFVLSGCSEEDIYNYYVLRHFAAIRIPCFRSESKDNIFEIFKKMYLMPMFL